MNSESLYDLEFKKMCRFCAYQERSIFEIKKKLTANIKDRSKIDKIITGLIEQNFLNEDRFIESYISGKASIKGWGEHKIRSGLKAHQINDGKISLAFSHHFQDRNLPKLKDLLRKKKEQLRNETPSINKKAKIIRYCLSKGFSLSDIVSCSELDS